MNAGIYPTHSFSASRFLELVRPKEHGSWSLALEPLSLGLIAAPSVGGGWLAVAVLAAFFARRPLRIALRDSSNERRAAARTATLVCGGTSLLAISAAYSFADHRWLIWLLPSAVAGAIFLAFDLRNDGRAELAEVAGATAFACLPAALAVIAGWGITAATVLAFLMLARALPAVLGVRACLRAKKTGQWHRMPALVTAALALAGTTGLWYTGFVPTIALALVVLLTVRTFGLLVYPRITVRARTLGIAEAVAGLLYVVTVGIALR